MAITSPFNHRSTALEVLNGHDLHGRYALVTGAASGIGVETVRALAAGGADVTLAVRDTLAGAEVVQMLWEDYPAAPLHVVALDLSSLASVRSGAACFLDRDVPLDILINNAGVMATPFAHTLDGFELQFGTNHLGHFVLTTSLLPALRRRGGSRVVALSSVGHRRSDVNFVDPNYANRPYERWESYGQSKTANALFAVGLTQRFAGDGLFANAVMPGGIMTGLQKHLSVDEQRTLGWIDDQGQPNPHFKTTAQGASTSIWAALGSELEGVGGLYLENCAQAFVMDPAAPNVGYMSYALDPGSADRLWDLSLELTQPG